jgi:hypothetical protein
MWAVLLAQARVEAAVSFVEGLFLIAFSVFCWRRAIAFDRDEFDADMVRAFGCVGSVLIAFFGLALILDARWLVMPEAWALKQVLQAMAGAS